MVLCYLTLNVCFGSFSDARRKSLSVRYVPEAEVNLGFMNVCFGGVVYQSVTEASYIGRGLRETEAHTRKYSLYIYF